MNSDIGFSLLRPAAAHRALALGERYRQAGSQNDFPALSFISSQVFCAAPLGPDAPILPSFAARPPLGSVSGYPTCIGLVTFSVENAPEAGATAPIAFPSESDIAGAVGAPRLPMVPPPILIQRPSTAVTILPARQYGGMLASCS